MALNIAAMQDQPKVVTSFLEGRAIRQAEEVQVMKARALELAEARDQEKFQMEKTRFSGEQKEQQFKFDQITAKQTLAATEQVLATGGKGTKALIESQFPEFVQEYTKKGGRWDDVDDEGAMGMAKMVRSRAMADLGMVEKPDEVSAETKFKADHEIRLQTLRNEGSLNTVRANASKGGAKQADLIDNPRTLDLASRVTLSNPERMSDYAARGEAGQARREQIADHQAKLLEEAGMSNNDLVQLRARVKAAQKTLGKVTEQGAQVEQAEGLARFNGQRLLELFEQVDDTGLPFIEGVMRSGFARGGGIDEAELKSVATAFRAETARLLTASPTMMGVVSDTARKEVENMAPDSMSTEQAKRVINRVFLEFDARKALNVKARAEAEKNTNVLSDAPTERPPAAPPAKNSKGWTLHTDAKGRKAYVGPNNEIELVK